MARYGNDMFYIEFSKSHQEHNKLYEDCGRPTTYAKIRHQRLGVGSA